MARPPKVARTSGRDEEPESRLPPRMEERETGLARLDPNAPIRTRSGKEARLLRDGNEDPYDLPAIGVSPPDGWVYGWKTKEINGKEDRHAMAMWEGNGWEPVPASRHDGLIMPRGFDGNIEYRGLILCERDARLNTLARHREKVAAMQQLRDYDDLSGLALSKGWISEEMADVTNATARRFTGVSKQRESIGLKNPTGYQVDE